jgi:hypothetical protein
MSLMSDILGTTYSIFQIGIGGVKLKNNSGNLIVRNATDSADASITASELFNSGDVIVVNSDAASTGADWKLNLKRQTTGMTGDVDFAFPANDGSVGQVLQTDGSGNTSWVSAGSTAACLTQDTTSLAFGSSSTVSMFTLPANAVIDSVKLIVDTSFDGTPQVSVGISSDHSKYMGAGQNDLKNTGLTAPVVWETNPGLIADGSSEALVLYYTAGSATVGAARCIVSYSVPN